MATCSLGGYVYPGDVIHYTYDALTSQHSATVCSGWLPGTGSPITQPTTAPSPGALPPGVECSGVPPGGKHTSERTAAGASGAVYLIRVDYHDRSDTGLLVVSSNDQEIARGALAGCGVAIWTFDVL